MHPALCLNGTLHDAADLKYRDGDWVPGTNNPRFPAGFVYQQDGENEPLCFTVTGRTLSLVYKKAAEQTYGMAGVWVNGHLAGIVNGYGVNAWGGPAVDCITAEETVQEMQVEIRMLDDHTDRFFEVYAIGVTD